MCGPRHIPIQDHEGPQRGSHPQFPDIASPSPGPDSPTVLDGAMSTPAASTPWWLDPGFLAFDTETTGTDSSSDRIVTAALVHFSYGEPVAEREWLLKLDIPIPQASTDVHGITDEHSRAHGQDEGEALAEVHQHITTSGLPIVAFNATFDIEMLNANLVRHRLTPITDTPIICPYVLDKQFDKYVKGRNQRRLMPTIQRYGLDLDEDSWHGATADATITGQLFLAEMNKYDALHDLTAHQLGESIATWRDEQDREFQAWLARKKAEESGNVQH